MHVIAKFGLVGIFSTVVHLTVGAALITHHVEPLLANFLAFLAAFTVSFLGHYYFSFKGHGNSLMSAVIKFTMVSLSIFGLNELMLFTLLHNDIFSEITALLVATSVASVCSFFLNRQWAFSKTKLVDSALSC